MGRGLGGHIVEETARAFAVATALVAMLVVSGIALEACSDSAAGGKWELQAPELTDGGYQLQLSSGQQRDLKFAYYTIIARQWSDVVAYYSAMTNVPLSVGENGTLVAPSDPEVLTLASDDGEDRDVVGAEWSSGDGAMAHYAVRNLSLMTSRDLFYAAPHDDVYLEAAVDEESGETEVEMFLGGDSRDPEQRMERSQLASYECAVYQLGSTHDHVEKTRAEDGSMAPVDEWEKSSYVGLLSCEYDQFFDVEFCPVSSLDEGYYYLQIVIEDTDGNLHGSELIQLETAVRDEGGEADFAELDTDFGKLSFRLEDGHAVLRKYEGEDAVVRVPEEVEGLPVTVVGENAFSKNEYMCEVALPDTIESIEDGAFDSSKLQRFVVPSSLKRLGDKVFRGALRLSEFVQDAANGVTSVRDGVLYSADGAELLCYPSAKGPTFDVPEGVTVIGRAAFQGTLVEHVSFPATLREIKAEAFSACEELDVVELPESLERIGAFAFGGWLTSHEGVGKTVRLGRNVSYVGSPAFGMWQLRAIEVDPRNAWYTSMNGMLIEKDGTLREVPIGLDDAIVVPEGVTSLPRNVLSNRIEVIEHRQEAGELADVFLPASVIDIEERALPTMASAADFAQVGEQVCTVKLHVPRGSWAEGYAQDNGFEYDNAKSPDELRFDEVVVPLRKARLTFRVYADHAVLVGIEADDAGHLEIPAYVDGVPVTVLGADKGDIATGTVITLVIPETVDEVGGTLLSKNFGMRQFELKGENEHFTVRNGSLCSADGCLLVKYPCGLEGSYDVPEGITEIGYKAFAGAKIESVSLPEGIASIDEAAFSGCSKLTEVNFPSSLEYVGPQAFSGTALRSLELNEGLKSIAKGAFENLDGIEALDIPDSVKSIGSGAFGSYVGGDGDLIAVKSGVVRIGAGLEQLEERAFRGLGFSAFEVSLGNPNFKADGPFLLSKDGRVLYACAGFVGAEIHVPESVEGIAECAFYDIPGLTDVYLPESVLRMSSVTFDYVARDSVTLHCAPGSEAALIAEAGGYNWVEE